MKKVLLLVVIMLLSLLSFSAMAWPEAPPMKVTLDDRELKFDVAPTVINGRTLVPLRVIFEALGAAIKWDETTGTVMAKKSDTEIRLKIDSPIAFKNGNPVTLDVPAQLISDRTMVPLRFISDALGAGVTWDEENNTARIYMNTYWPTKGWKTSTPEEQGMDSRMLEKLYKDITEKGEKVDGVVVIRNGFLVSEKYFGDYSMDTRHDIFSDTKSVTSMLTGMALDRGYLKSIDQKVMDFFPEITPENDSEEKQQITIRDALQMASGLQWESDDELYSVFMRADNSMQFILGLPMAAKPGTQFNYNTGMVKVLSAVLQRATDKTVAEFARDTLFKYLGITNYLWPSDRTGITVGGTGLELTPRDMAKLGYLYLKGGVWEGRQVVPADWVRESTSKHMEVSDVRGDGYGYLWWVRPDLDGYAAVGRHGQWIFVLPKLDMVVVLTGSQDNLRGQASLVKNYILPAVQK